MDEVQSSPPVPVPPKTSALVLSYNDAAGLRRCLSALEASTARAEMEIIVMDNGSSDGSGSMDAEYPDATFLRLPRNFGAAKALNIGMRTAVGEYIFFLTPDIEVAPDTVAKLAAELDTNADAAAVCPLGAKIWRLPDTRTLKQVWRDPSMLQAVTPPVDGGPVTVEYAGRDSLMARKFFIRGLNYIDERYGDFGVDLEVAFQIRRAQRRIMLVPDARIERHPGHPLPAASIVMADRANAVSTFLSKHAGMLAGMLFQVGAALGALMRFQFGVAFAIASGSKIDGSQSGV